MNNCIAYASSQGTVLQLTGRVQKASRLQISVILAYSWASLSHFGSAESADCLFVNTEGILSAPALICWKTGILGHGCYSPNGRTARVDCRFAIFGALDRVIGRINLIRARFERFHMVSMFSNRATIRIKRGVRGKLIIRNTVFTSSWLHRTVHPARRGRSSSS
jgi:hypothetical protein